MVGCSTLVLLTCMLPLADPTGLLRALPQARHAPASCTASRAAAAACDCCCAHSSALPAPAACAASTGAGAHPFAPAAPAHCCLRGRLWRFRRGLWLNVVSAMQLAILFSAGAAHVQQPSARWRPWMLGRPVQDIRHFLRRQVLDEAAVYGCTLAISAMGVQQICWAGAAV